MSKKTAIFEPVNAVVLIRFIFLGHNDLFDGTRSDADEAFGSLFLKLYKLEAVMT